MALQDFFNPRRGNQSDVSQVGLKSLERDKLLPRSREFIGPALNADAKVTVSGPSLIRLDRWSNGAIPTDSIRVTFDTDRGAIDESTAIVMVGNYVFLPEAGIYRIRNVSNSPTWTGGGVNLVGSLWENIDPSLAIAILTSVMPAFTDVTRNVVLAAGVANNLDRFTIGGVVYPFRVHSAIISNNGAGDLIVGIGITPTAILGHPVAVAGTLLIPPGQISGTNLAGFSVAGTIASVTLSYR